MTQNVGSQQPNLFELVEETPRIAVPPALKAELATLMEVLLAEIAATLAKEVGDEQDHQ
jgi:hypothetical protein